MSRREKDGRVRGRGERLRVAERQGGRGRGEEVGEGEREEEGGKEV